MIIVRKAAAADASLLPDIERSAGKAFLTIPDLAWIAEDDVQPLDRHLELIAGGNSWVAVDEGDAPIGFLSAERIGDRLHIWELAVLHECQGRGIGRALLGEAVESARSQGCLAVTLTTFRDLRWNQPFYESVGFRMLGGGEIPADLQAILDREIANGLPGEKRCAMRLPLFG
ncbi:GNAT family N-acetyltransferase [Gilvimarinus sp. F26214L]|uniref:GNAT family N-acetyltransferase n=1 Tax=Gilvimarinus sp. DZF01 TaxID=3461371 RepID=UPI00404539C3